MLARVRLQQFAKQRTASRQDNFMRRKRTILTRYRHIDEFVQFLQVLEVVDDLSMEIVPFQRVLMIERKLAFHFYFLGNYDKTVC